MIPSDGLVSISCVMVSSRTPLTSLIHTAKVTVVAWSFEVDPPLVRQTRIATWQCHRSQALCGSSLDALHTQSCRRCFRPEVKSPSSLASPSASTFRTQGQLNQVLQRHQACHLQGRTFLGQALARRFLRCLESDGMMRCARRPRRGLQPRRGTAKTRTLRARTRRPRQRSSPKRWMKGCR